MIARDGSVQVQRGPYTPAQVAYMRERGGVIATTVTNAPPPSKGPFTKETSGIGAMEKGNAPVWVSGPVDSVHTFVSAKDTTFGIQYWVWLLVLGVVLALFLVVR